MTRRELVKAAIQHKETPVCPYYIRVTGESNQQIREATGKEPGEWLDNDVEDIGAPWWGWNNLADDWRRTEAPTSQAKVVAFGDYNGLGDRIKQRRDECDKYFLTCIWGSHFEKAYFARGFEGFMMDLALNYQFAKDLCRGIIEKNLVMLENFLSIAEIDGVLLGSDWGSQRGLLMSLDMWDDIIRPGEQAEYDLIHSYGKDVWVHSCGDVSELVPRLVEMGLDVLNPVQPECMDIDKLKKNHGEDLSFWGGISTQKTLPYGTPDEVRAESRRIRDLLGAGGGYVLSPSQEIQGDVPFKNIEALLDVAREGR